jgi:hypothetical protein
VIWDMMKERLNQSFKKIYGYSRKRNSLVLVVEKDGEIYGQFGKRFKTRNNEICLTEEYVRDEKMLMRENHILEKFDPKDEGLVHDFDKMNVEEALFFTEGGKQNIGSTEKITESRRLVLVGYNFIKDKITKNSD